MRACRLPSRSLLSSPLRLSLAIAAVSLLAGSGCGEDAPPVGPGAGEPGSSAGKADAPAADDPGTPTITFGADSVVSQSGSLVAGGHVRIVYALERLDECRASSGGYPQWSVTGYRSVDGGPGQPFEVSRTSGSARLPVAAVLEVPRGRDLAFWFEATSTYGCHAYDSRDGANFHFDIQAVSGADALLIFGADGQVEQQGTIVAGGTLRVRYALERLDECRGTQAGRPQWNITGAISVDGGQPEAFEVSQVAGDDRVSQDAVLDVPAGSELALWFTVGNRWGCVGYDSRYGQNYVFPIAAP